MFDIGFWELALIGVVALLVVGPDRLPGLARTVGLWVGRIRRYASAVRDDIEREIQADELKKMLEKPDDLNPLQDLVAETKHTIDTAKNELASVENDAQNLVSNDSPLAQKLSDSDDGNDDETGAEPITPGAAATAVGKAVSPPVESPEQAPAEPSRTTGDSTQADEQPKR